MLKKLSYTTLLGSMLIACSQIPPEAYYARGNPESLLESSSEIVNLPVDSMGAIQDLTSWINRDQPSRAELSCDMGNSYCAEAQQVLSQFGVPTKSGMGEQAGVALIYERTMARECENRFIDNSINPYNLNHPTFGCSTAMNMVQMVTDKRQFTHPALSDYADAEKAVQAATFHRIPSAYTPPNADPNFTAISTSGVSR